MSDLNLGMPTSTVHGSTVHASEFRSMLRDRLLGGLVNFPGRSWQCVFLKSGSLSRISAEHENTVTAPAILWLPSDRETRLRARAGSTGVLMTLGETTLANAIGHKPEAAALRVMSSRQLTLDLAPRPETSDSLQACFTAILQELGAETAGMETVIEAQIRIMLVSLWRAVMATQTAEPVEVNPNQTLESFRQLLETHLRERWPVNRYAEELRISPDRLHDICVRNLRKPPQRLIQERLTFEAQVLLERSHQTLDQIADYLGFRSAPQFSAFFKKQTQIPPGRFRKALRQRDRAPELVPSRTYADWP